MDYIRLGDVATYINGYAFKPEDRGQTGLPIIRIQDLTGNAYALGFYDGEYPKKIEINNGDVLISWSASLGIYVWNKGKALLNQHIFRVVFDKKPIDKQFFIFAVENSLHLMASKTHGATMKHIIKTDFDNTLIPYPSIKKQREIASILTKVETIINARKNELQRLDDLIKARFVEMFEQDFSGERVKLLSLCEVITKGTTPTTLGFPFTESGVNFIKIENISNNERINLDNVLHISDECNKKLKRSILKENDILFSIAGTKMGITAKVTKDVLPANTNQALAIIRLSSSKMNVDFLLELLHSAQIIEQIESKKNGVAQTNLSLDDIRNFDVIVPSVKKQTEYASFVSQVDKSKVVVQKALNEAQLLFDSLMQQYFG